MNHPSKLYMVWKEEDEFWSYYDTISDAISDCGDGTEVFEANLKSLGHYKNLHKVKKMSKRELDTLNKGED